MRRIKNREGWKRGMWWWYCGGKEERERVKRGRRGRERG
jgi:hypothetical protein